MRTAFINQLVESARQHDNIFLLVGDLGFHVVEPFAEQFPDRFLNVGIAEQNMIGVAAGLAKEGYNVYVYSIANFPTLRCIEQIRYDVCYHNLSVKIVAVGAGYAYGSLGASHHATEDIGVMRSLPDIIVTSPCDPAEAQAITTLSANYQGPMYLRLGKAGEKEIHPAALQNLHIGDILTLSQGDDTLPAVLSTGSITRYVLDFLTTKHIEAPLYSFPFVKPINTDQLTEIANRHSSLIVIEEHQKSCGFGSAVIEQLSDLYYANKISVFPRIKRIAIPDCFYHTSGSQDYLRQQAGLILTNEMFK